MREYKFRAWHGGHKHAEPQMLYDEKPGDCLRWKADGQNIVSIMQYTGLKDRNGKEIYEQDICTDDDGRSVIRVLWNDKHQWGCRIEKGGALTQGLTFPLWHWDKCEMNAYRTLGVIGNALEHPHLLEQGEKE